MVEDAVKEKRIRYKAYNALKKAGKVVEAKESKTAYNEAKRVAKHVVWLAKSEDERGYLPTSPLLVMASFGWPNKWTAQIRMLAKSASGTMLVSFRSVTRTR